MEQEQATEEHRWLGQLVGDWVYETTAVMGPDEPRATFKGSDQVRAIGDFWIVAEGVGEMPGGGTARMMMTLGYDPRRKRFVGTFIHAAMSFLWPYDGQLDAARRVLTLDSEGPAMHDPSKTARYRDVITLIDDGERTFSSMVQGDDGQWTEFMSTRYRRA